MMINNTNNNILWRERQETIVRPKGDKKSKLSKQQTELYLQQHKQLFLSRIRSNGYYRDTNIVPRQGI